MKNNIVLLLGYLYATELIECNIYYFFLKWDLVK